MIKAVLMDIDNTLLDFDISSEQGMYQVAKEMNITLPENAYEIFKKVNPGIWKELEQGKLTNEELFLVRWNRIFEVMGVQGDGAAFEVEYLKYIKQSAVPVPGAKEIMEYLSEKYVVCGASNGPYGQQVNRMKMADMLQHVQHMFVSEKVGYSKPQKEFFDTCFEAIAPIRPEETIMIGDSVSADIRGAKAYGMKTCWFNHDRVENPQVGGADYIVNSLAEIKNIL